MIIFIKITKMEEIFNEGIAKRKNYNIMTLNKKNKTKKNSVRRKNEKSRNNSIKKNINDGTPYE